MFDDLHDPDPPLADVPALTRVAHRADQLRRRRALVLGTAAGAFVVALTLAGVALASRDDGDGDGQLVAASTPSSSADTVTTDSTAGTAVTSSSSSTTTSVPPPTAVPPINPSPVPLPPTSTEAPDTTTVDITTVPEETSTTSSTVVETTTTTTVPVPKEPIVAVNGAGDAVLVALDGTTTLLFDGPDPDDPPPAEGGTTEVDLVAVTPDKLQAFIGICCEPLSGTLYRTTPPTPATTQSSNVMGHAPAISPSGSTIASVRYDTVVVSDLSLRDLATIPEQFDIGNTYDLAWVDDRHLASLRFGPDGASLRMLQFSGNALTEVAAVQVPDSATLAGRGDGIVYVAGISPGVLAALDLTTLAPRSERNIGLPDASSAWVDEGIVRWVDGARTLHLGDAVVPGEYVWVR